MQVPVNFFPPQNISSLPSPFPNTNPITIHATDKSFTIDIKTLELFGMFKNELSYKNSDILCSKEVTFTFDSATIEAICTYVSDKGGSLYLRDLYKSSDLMLFINLYKFARCYSMDNLEESLKCCLFSEKKYMDWEVFFNLLDENAFNFDQKKFICFFGLISSINESESIIADKLFKHFLFVLHHNQLEEGIDELFSWMPYESTSYHNPTFLSISLSILFFILSDEKIVNSNNALAKIIFSLRKLIPNIYDKKPEHLSRIPSEKIDLAFPILLHLFHIAGNIKNAELAKHLFDVVKSTVNRNQLSFNSFSFLRPNKIKFKLQESVVATLILQKILPFASSMPLEESFHVIKDYIACIHFIEINAVILNPKPSENFSSTVFSFDPTSFLSNAIEIVLELPICQDPSIKAMIQERFSFIKKPQDFTTDAVSVSERMDVAHQDFLDSLNRINLNLNQDITILPTLIEPNLGKANLKSPPYSYDSEAIQQIIAFLHEKKAHKAMRVFRKAEQNTPINLREQCQLNLIQEILAINPDTGIQQAFKFIRLFETEVRKVFLKAIMEHAENNHNFLDIFKCLQKQNDSELLKLFYDELIIYALNLDVSEKLIIGKTFFTIFKEKNQDIKKLPENLSSFLDSLITDSLDLEVMQFVESFFPVLLITKDPNFKRKELCHFTKKINRYKPAIFAAKMMLGKTHEILHYFVKTRSFFKTLRPLNRAIQLLRHNPSFHLPVESFHSLNAFVLKHAKFWGNWAIAQSNQITFNRFSKQSIDIFKYLIHENLKQAKELQKENRDYENCLITAKIILDEGSFNQWDLHLDYIETLDEFNLEPEVIECISNLFPKFIQDVEEKNLAPENHIRRIGRILGKRNLFSFISDFCHHLLTDTSYVDAKKVRNLLFICFCVNIPYGQLMSLLKLFPLNFNVLTAIANSRAGIPSLSINEFSDAMNF
ncbi:hypothetical protein [Parachlamydia acanthamoebae]|uniref:hypothetical protein n=1 Tax=Parachlamydia acanthamoebae TaxID=83552 RepID=UPI0024E1CCDE|nr:hypothetical protein [Parachlamydia acanthamoebae]